MRFSFLVLAHLALCAAARAQVVAAPESLRVVLPQGQEATVIVTLTNGGAAALPFCLDFDRPLQRTPPGTLGAGCGPPGELLGTADSEDVGRGWIPQGLTMTPDGRLFVADFTIASGAEGTRGWTYELTADLTYVRTYRQPGVAEMTPFARSEGVTYDADAGTLWWTNAEVTGSDVRRILLLEGTLDGVATGRRVEVPVPPTGPPPANAGYPKGAVYEPHADRFYYLDGRRDELWAVDTAGAVVEGYPVTLAAYPPAEFFLGNEPDVHGGPDGGASGVRVEVPLGSRAEDRFTRVVATDPSGVAVYGVTPLGRGPGNGLWMGYVVRSRVDPNGVMYATYVSTDTGVAAVRPAPLSPTWLVLPTWSGELGAGGSVEVALTFRAGERAPGEYRTTLAVEDEAGVTLAQVPLTLVVEDTTPATEGPPGGEDDLTLSVAPNPTRGAATVALTLSAPARVRVAVLDVLGREVARAHDGPLAAGPHRLPLALARLAPGLYLVRAEAAGHAATARLTLAR